MICDPLNTSSPLTSCILIISYNLLEEEGNHWIGFISNIEHFAKIHFKLKFNWSRVISYIGLLCGMLSGWSVTKVETRPLGYEVWRGHQEAVLAHYNMVHWRHIACLLIKYLEWKVWVFRNMNLGKLENLMWLILNTCDGGETKSHAITISHFAVTCSVTVGDKSKMSRLPGNLVVQSGQERRSV